jgi:hypothetical protein
LVEGEGVEPSRPVAARLQRVGLAHARCPSDTQTLSVRCRRWRRRSAPRAIRGDVEIRFTCQRATKTLASHGPVSSVASLRHSGSSTRLVPGFKPNAPFRSRSTYGCVEGNKKPHRAGRLRRARWGPIEGPDARCYITIAPSEPSSGRLPSSRNSPDSSQSSAWSRAAGSMVAGIADMAMPSATAAFAGAVLGIDVAIAHMTEPVYLSRLMSCRSTLAGARVYPSSAQFVKHKKREFALLGERLM